MDPRTVHFVVWGDPKPKGSAKGFLHKQTGRVIVHADNRPSLKAWEACIRDAAQQVAGDVFFMNAVELRVTFVFPRPKSVSEKKRPEMTTAPDLSKLVRGVEDAITNVLWTDDALVTRIIASKTYGPPDQPGRAEISITELVSTVAEGRLVYETSEA